MIEKQKLVIAPYVDGAQDDGFEQIEASWQLEWGKHYGAEVELQFEQPINVKEAAESKVLPTRSRAVVVVRNPDIFFIEKTKKIELGGIEFTTHSPDGSNVEKRYPFIWASRQQGLTAIIASPYQKQRPKGGINRLPFRHAAHNQRLLSDWDISKIKRNFFCQIIPITNFQSKTDVIPEETKSLMLSIAEIGAVFAHLLASKALSGILKKNALKELKVLKSRLIALSTSCMKNTKHTEASSLLRDGDRWVQIYNTRPDSGHWERGEGQFDSIDGRIMFTLDEIAELPLLERPSTVELWFPQLVSKHPWVLEQKSRGYGSKRFRNIMVVLKGQCVVKFADDLTSNDWVLLQENPGLTLERLDWKPKIYQISQVMKKQNIEKIARAGLKSPSETTVREIQAILESDHIMFSTHRAYDTEWAKNLSSELNQLQESAIVLLPRIPKKIINEITHVSQCKIVPAEEVTKIQLLALRQIHRSLACPN